MKKAHVVTGIVLVLAALGTQACTLGSDTYITAEKDDTEPADTSDAGPKTDASSSQNLNSGAAASCSGGSYTAPDVSKLTACGDGKGHCYAAAKTPFADMLGACPTAGEVCVPDEVLAANGNRLKQCKSIIGDGGCITMSLIPAMQADTRAKSLLKQDVCDADQICAPCINPEDNGATTPFCQPIGVYGECSGGGTAPAADAGPVAPPKPLPTCCSHGWNSSGVCISEQAIPESERGDAPDDTCASGDKCVPKAIFEGKPVICNSGLLGKGVCLDTCFNEMMGFASMIGVLGKDLCAPTEVCVPCTFMSGKGVTACD
jgi:hypothetical protein